MHQWSITVNQFKTMSPTVHHNTDSLGRQNFTVCGAGGLIEPPEIGGKVLKKRLQ